MTLRQYLLALTLVSVGYFAGGSAQAQLPPAGGLTINTTKINGGTNNLCLYIASGKLGQQACGSGTAGDIKVGTTTVSSGTTARILYDNAGVLGEYTLTGSGTVVAMQTSPSLVTPALGVATGTSLALGGATLGSDVFAATGSTAISGNIKGAGQVLAVSNSATFGLSTETNSGYGFSAATGGNLYFTLRGVVLGTLDGNGILNGFGAIGIGGSNPTANAFLTAPSTGSVQLGKADAAVAVAQTLRVQSVVAGTAAANGANWTLIGSLPTGTGTSGDIIFQTGVKTGSGTTQGTATTALTIKGETQALVTSALDAGSSTGGALQVVGGASVAKRFWIPAITTSAGLQTAVLCQSSGGEMIADSIACLASSGRFKTIQGPVTDGALAKLIALPIERWSYKAEGIFADTDWTRERIGPIAEDVAAMDPRLVGYDAEGKVRSISTEQLLAFTIKAVQEQQIQIEELKRQRQ